MSAYENRSIERCFQVLESLNASVRPLTLSEIAERVDLHKATTFRILDVLGKLGYVTKDPSALQYSVGCRLQGFGWRSKVVQQVAAQATPFLQTLSGYLGMTSYLCTREGRDVVGWVVCKSGERCIEVKVGAHRDAHTAAEGKVLLAQCAPQKVRMIYDQETLRRNTSRSIASLEQLLRALAETRNLGYAIDDRETYTDIRSIAVPVHGLAKRARFAIAVSARHNQMPDEMIPVVVEKARKCAAEISEFLARKPQPADATESQASAD